MDSKQARVVIVGGGFGGLFTALDLAGTSQVTLISPEDHFTFTPLLYEYLSGEVEEWHIAPRYKELLGDRVPFIRGEVTEVDLQAHTVAVAGRESRIPYDVLVLAVGGTTNYAGIEGAEQYSLPFRKVEHADALRQRMIATLDRIPPDAAPQDARQAAIFAIVGAGASGVELSIKMADLLHDAFRRRGLRGDPRVMVIEMGRQVLPGMEDDLRAYVEQVLTKSRIETLTSTRVRRVTPHGLVYEHNGAQTEVEAAAVVWVGGVRVNPLVERLDIEKDKHGLIAIEPTLQARGHRELFVLGDITHYKDAAPTLAGTAQLAFQEAGLVARNVRALLAGRPLETRHFAELGEAVSLGTENAAIFAAGQVLHGPLARRARFAMYTSRLPTWQHRLKVSASWFFEGTQPRPLGLRRP